MAPEEALPEETPQEPTTPESAPQIDLDAAIEAVSSHYGWDPRVADYEIREFGKRKAKLEAEKRELDAERDRLRRSSAVEIPAGYETDPTFRTVAELARELREDREERKREKEAQAQADRLAQDLETGYSSLMARVPNKVDRTSFFNAMLEVYPDQALLERVGIDRAVQVVHRYMGNQNGHQPLPRPASRRDPIVVPGGTTGGAGPPVEDIGPQRPGETTEQYHQRLVAFAQAQSPMPGLRDGQKVSSG